MEKYINKHVLFQHNIAQHEHQIFEGVVRALSPSGKFVRLAPEGWFKVEKITILEVLPDLEPKAPCVLKAPQQEAEKAPASPSPPPEPESTAAPKPEESTSAAPKA